MKKASLSIIVVLMCFLAACTEDTFEETKMNQQPPSNLSYSQLINAYLGEGFKSGQPSVQTNGQEPTFILTGGRSSTNEMDEAMLSLFEVVDSTGIVKLEEGNMLGLDAYQLDISVETIYGKTDFPAGFTFEITEEPVEAE
ncbi:hypothetical protein J1N10_14280 [Carboxylicivirga sp. A043]|uniref:hypothetical protein n=1 Tax=Carboxylicivirga litoralis TaxID=2816963 RepID=UPI0021CB268D|nr:hypothetical protein [Carboxylicivirga sp. A043]MCU4157151.1 hypothetical protein [Carboxylicivirga sp. A043]